MTDPPGDAPSARGPGAIITFTSSTSGLGRTGAIANVAVILAASGARVLVVDWSTESLSVHGYLARFHVDTSTGRDRLIDAFERAASGAEWRSGAGQAATWRTHRYRLPAGMGRVDLITRADARGERQVWLPWHDQVAQAVGLREAVRMSGYDYVLIDSPTDASRTVGRIIARVSDVVVISFLMGGLSVSDAVSLAHRLDQHADRELRIVPVPAQVDHGDPVALAGDRRRVRDAFAELGSAASELAGRFPEIPYRRYGVGEGVLATLTDDPGGSDSLLRAYERLTGVITQGAVTALSPPSREVRARYRRVCGLDAHTEPETMSVAYVPQDRMWADWIRAQLESAGVRVRMLAEAAGDAEGPLLVVVSPRARESGLAAWPAGPGAKRAGAETVAVRVTGGPSPEIPASARLLDLAESGRVPARARLLAYFGLIGAPPVPARTRRFVPRFPKGGKRVFATNLPTAKVTFTGRAAELEWLRDHLLAADAASGPAVLSGPRGIGKSELARQYAWRFRADYDLIWWISANDIAHVRAGLAELAGRLGVPPAGDATEAALAELRSATSARRWLLIYDDAEDLAGLAELLAAGDLGHVIVTTRLTPAEPDPATPPIGPLSVEEGADFLVRRAGRIGRQRARDIAAAVECLPYSLQLAAAWLRETTAWLRAQGAMGTQASGGWAAAEFLARLEQQAAPSPAAACLAITFGTMESSGIGRLTRRLLELCAWLSPYGIARRLLCSAAFVEALADAAGDDGEVLEEDSALLHRIFRIAVRHALVEVRWSPEPAVRVHRMTQELVREGLDSATRRLRQGQVLHALAATVPTEADSSVRENDAVFIELQTHLLPSGAPHRTERAIRRWVVNQVRYRYITGDRGTWEPTLRLAEEVLDRWRRDVGASDLLLTRLMGQVANLRRALGDYRGALEMSDAALTAQRAAQGSTHFRALVSARGRAGDLRGLGMFRASLAEDQTTYAAFAEAFGDDHPETVVAQLNLAVSWHLMGYHEVAVNTIKDAYRRTCRRSGDDDWLPLWMARQAAEFLCDLGDPAAARTSLVETLRKVRALRPKRAIDELYVARGIAAADRLLGDTVSAHERDTEVHDGLRQLLGPAHPGTIAVRLSLAADKHLAGDHAAAVELAAECLDAFGRLFDDVHPYTHVCTTDLGVFHLDAGDVDRSVRLTREAWTALRETLGDQHPWSMVAGVNHTRSLVAAGEIAVAHEIDEAIADDCREILGADHGYTRLAAKALADSRRRVGDGSRAAGARGRPSLHLDVPTP